MAPWVKMAMSVVPPPMSSRQTPRSFSSSESTARAEASGCRIRSFTSSPQRRTHFTMFCAADTAPVTMWTLSSSRTPDMPIGSRTSSWPSMMNSWRSTCRICWSVGMLTARAVSIARSTSSPVTSRSLIATIPVELKLRMWLPAMPTNAELILQSAISSASSSARWIAATVASMFTTTPFFRPFDSWPPMPRISREPSARSSATRHATFEVPMSSATMRSLLSLAIGSAVQLRHPQGKAVGIAQVHILVSAREPAERRRIGLDEAPEARLGAVGVTPEHDLQAAVEPELPRAALGKDHALELRAERRHRFGEANVTLRHFELRAGGGPEHRQDLIGRTVEALAVGIHQPLRTPARERHVLLEADLQPVGPDAAHGSPAYPWQRLEPCAQPRRGHREKIAADMASRGRLDLRPRGLAQRMRKLDLGDRKERRARDQRDANDGEHEHRNAHERPGRQVEQTGLIPHEQFPES